VEGTVLSAEFSEAKFGNSGVRHNFLAVTITLDMQIFVLLNLLLHQFKVDMILIVFCKVVYSSLLGAG